MDFVRAMRIYLKNGYDGVMVPDHTPQMACDAPWHAGMAYALGYMRALIQALQAESRLAADAIAHIAKVAAFMVYAILCGMGVSPMNTAGTAMPRLPAALLPIFAPWRLCVSCFCCFTDICGPATLCPLCETFPA